MINDGYSVCSNQWAIDKDIKNELGLLLIISSLCADKGYCWATNEYLSKLFEESEVSISRKIKNLADKEYINIDYERNGTQITKRIVTINKIVNGGRSPLTKKSMAINKNDKENNTNNNNLYYLFINKIIKEKSKMEFEPIPETDKVNQVFMWAIEQPEYNQLSPKEQNNIKMDIYGRYE